LEESIVLAQGKFFVSLQTKGSDYLNIGFDRNTNSAEYTFSKTSSYWQQSFEKGSVMMRPYFGAAAAVGLNSAESREISVYPNPSSSKLYFRNCENASKELFDINGRSLLKTKDNELNIEHLNSGVYILRIIDVNGSVQHTKIIKSK
jgi:hypothetical protein